MTAASKRPNPSKVKKTTVLTAKVTTTASSGIKHQVILPKTLTVAPSSSISSSKIKHTSTNRNTNTNTNTNCSIPHTIPSPITQPQPLRAVAVPVANVKVQSATKKQGVWYLGGNHLLKLLTSVDGDLDHSILSKLAAVPTVVGELALSVESLVSDDVTVGDFENDLLAKIASNTLTAKRGIMAAKAAAVKHNSNFRSAINSNSSAMPLATVSPTPMATCTTPIPTNHEPASTIASGANTAASSTESNNKNANNPAATGPCGSEQVPNPLLANYQPVPNPLAIRITPPASPHVIMTNANANANVNAEKQQRLTSTTSESSSASASASASTTNATSNNANKAETIRTGVPMIHVR